MTPAPRRLPLPFLRGAVEDPGNQGRMLRGHGYVSDLGAAIELAGRHRAVWCLQYGSCLDLAAREDWASWSCLRCPLWHQAKRPDVADASARRIDPGPGTWHG